MVIDDQGRPEPPDSGDELSILLGFLEFHRATFAWKTSGLDAAGLRATVGASDMTLGGMTKHLALVEDDWFIRDLFDEPMPPPWDTVDWAADRDWEWHSARDDDPAGLSELWHAACERSRAAVQRALAEGAGLDLLTRRELPGGRRVSLRWILVHMIEEYSRHNGHADLIRESIDGQTGE